MKQYLILWFLFCIIGAGLEWAYGVFWSMVGSTPWIYPTSPLHYTSLEMLPLWGFGGLICISIYKSIVERKVKLLTNAVIPLVLAALWILFYATIWARG